MCVCFVCLACSKSSKGVQLDNTSRTYLQPFNPFYPNNLQCTWYITAPTNQIIRFWFTKFDLTQPGDNLKIFEQKQVDFKFEPKLNFTGKIDLKERWTSKKNYLKIVFSSDDDTVGQGFGMAWKFINKPKGRYFSYIVFQIVGMVRNSGL